MNIGEKIYQLRIEKNLSQGDLADKLDVSRQSVSKWENNTAVPDLDKLMKLCDVFEVSLDELVGREVKQTEKPLNEMVVYKNSLTQTKMIGYILLAVAILADVMALFVQPEAVLLITPILLCSIICLTVKRYAWYWCIWAVYIPVEFFMLMRLRVDIRFIVKIVFIIIIAVVTCIFFKDINSKLSPKKRFVMLISSGLFIVLCVIAIWLIFYSGHIPIFVYDGMWIYSAISVLLTVAAGVVIFQTNCLIREARQKK